MKFGILVEIINQNICPDVETEKEVNVDNTACLYVTTKGSLKR